MEPSSVFAYYDKKYGTKKNCIRANIDVHNIMTILIIKLFINMNIQKQSPYLILRLRPVRYSLNVYHRRGKLKLKFSNNRPPLYRKIYE